MRSIDPAGSRTPTYAPVWVGTTPSQVAPLQVAGWTNLSAWLPEAPSARDEAAFAFDPASHRAVLFGGQEQGTESRDTWTFANDSWTPATPIVLNATNSPSARFGAAMAYDPNLGGLILFGGRTGLVAFNDTWLWRNGSWISIPTAVAPSPRAYASLSFVPSLDELVLFGGWINGNSLSDTWAFTSNGWVDLTASAGAPPAARGFAAFAYDPNAGGDLLYGGSTSARTFGDTWLFNASGWVQVSPPTAPESLTASSLVYDSEIGAMLLLYGDASSGRPVASAWEFANGTWTNLSIGAEGLPSPRDAAAVAELTGLPGPGSEIVLFGGAENGLTEDNDTWLIGSPLPFGATPPSSARLSVDQGDTLHITTEVLGGTPPYSYAWTGLSNVSCAAGNVSNFNCTPVGTGTGSSVITVGLTVTDANGSSVAPSPTTFLINPPLAFTSFVISPYQDPVGTAITGAVKLQGGTAPESVQYFGLPPGCGNITGFSFKCFPNVPGTYTVTAYATDAVGEVANESRFVVVSLPANGAPVPWLTIVLVLGLAISLTLLAIAAVGYVRRGKVGAVSPPPAAPPPVSPPGGAGGVPPAPPAGPPQG